MNSRTSDIWSQTSNTNLLVEKVRATITNINHIKNQLFSKMATNKSLSKTKTFIYPFDCAACTVNLCVHLIKTFRIQISIMNTSFVLSNWSIVYFIAPVSERENLNTDFFKFNKQLGYVCLYMKAAEILIT